MPRERYKVSIDIGGTFTDVVAMRESDGFIQVLKVSSSCPQRSACQCDE